MKVKVFPTANQDEASAVRILIDRKKELATLQPRVALLQKEINQLEKLLGLNHATLLSDCGNYLVQYSNDHPH